MVYISLTKDRPPCPPKRKGGSFFLYGDLYAAHQHRSQNQVTKGYTIGSSGVYS